MKVERILARLNKQPKGLKKNMTKINELYTMTCSPVGLISFDRAQVAQARNMTIGTVAYLSNYKDLYGKKKNICFCSLRT